MRPIDADALLEAIEELKKSPWYNGENGNFERLVRSDAIGIIEDLCVKEAPTLDYAPVKHGEWVDKPTGAYGAWQTWCSACGKRSGIGGIASNQHKPFCPNCGAHMTDEGKNDA